jgi:microcystin-dependent protein
VVFGLDSAPRAYQTPAFSPSDPLVCHELQLRPSLWAVVFYTLQVLSEPYSWRQDDPVSATVYEVIKEIAQATDDAVFRGCTVIGQVIELSLADPPAWALRCNGATYANVDYPELAAVIHAGLIVDDDHFRVPDRDRRIGVDGFYPGMQGGEETHVLTIAELPVHDHPQDQWSTAPSVVLGELPGFEAAPVAGNTGLTGGGDAHENMPPYEGSQFFIIARLPTAG